ncbi:MAG TPA: beta-propeller fold lactonase family protein, partial [Ktedonobacterales bacterium]|nr:beta-propeller fold lactonase family protein [Ktedonobacterales bacterium]
GQDVYVSDNQTGRLFVIDTATQALVTSVKVGERPALIARSPDGKTLYVANGVSHSVSIVDISQPAAPVVTASVTVSGYPHGLAVTPDGRYVVVAQTLGKTLSVIDTQTRSVVAVVTGMQYPNDVLIPA